MSNKTYPYDERLPFVLVNRTVGMVGRAANKQLAQHFSAGLDVDIIDTTPKPRVPEDARFITWKDEYGDRWYAEKLPSGKWLSDDGFVFILPSEDLPGDTPGKVFTVLEERKN